MHCHQMIIQLFLFSGGFTPRKRQPCTYTSNPSWTCAQLCCLLLWDLEFASRVFHWFSQSKLAPKLPVFLTFALMSLLQLTGLLSWQNKPLMMQLRSWTTWMMKHTRTALWSFSCWETTWRFGPLICLLMHVWYWLRIYIILYFQVTQPNKSCWTMSQDKTRAWSRILSHSLCVWTNL